jgi:hypothetical protein
MQISGPKLPAFPEGNDPLTLISLGTSDRGPVIILSMGRPEMEENVDGEFAANVVLDLEDAKGFVLELLGAVVLSVEDLDGVKGFTLELLDAMKAAVSLRWARRE